MSQEILDESFSEQEVTYTLEIDGRFVIVEHVPARVSLRTGERFFAPETVKRIQRIVWEGKRPDRVVEAPVFEYHGIMA
jgi:hypothetical protein